MCMGVGSNEKRVIKTVSKEKLLRDHLAYLINTTPTPILIVGDAELTTWAMQDEILVSTVDGARGKQEVQRSATMIRTFRATYPSHLTVSTRHWDTSR